MDLEGQHARVLFRAEGQGRVGDIHVGYIGGEAVGLTHEGGAWEPDQGIWLPRLEGVLDMLRRRDQALAKGDAASLASLALEPTPMATLSSPAELPPVRAWLVRIEGEGAVVSEVTGQDAGTSTKRLELRQRQNGWRFASGLL